MVFVIGGRCLILSSMCQVS